VRIPIEATDNRLTFSFETSLLLVSPLLTKSSNWGVFSPFGLTVTYRF